VGGDDLREVVEVGGHRDVAAHAGGGVADRRDGLVDRGLIASGDEDVGAVGSEPLRGGQPDAGRSAGDECGLPAEL
jgi:hypothetical protein